jgi:hypothetical protein
MNFLGRKLKVFLQTERKEAVVVTDRSSIFYYNNLGNAMLEVAINLRNRILEI